MLVILKGLGPGPGAPPTGWRARRSAEARPLDDPDRRRRPGQFLLTVPQVARLLGMTPKAKYHCAERGQLPGVVRVWRSLLFGRADL